MSEAEKNIRVATICIADMTCVNCERKIEEKLKGTDGILDASARFADGSARVTYDADKIDVGAMEKMIGALGYRITKERGGSGAFAGVARAACIAAALCGLYALLARFGLLNFLYDFPEAREGMGYGMLFLVGLLTSMHCVGMCGGINLSQSLPGGAKSSSTAPRFAVMRSGFLYNLGRAVSYTLLGGAIGALGAAVSPSEGFKIGVQLAAGIFMIVMGLNMLNAFSWPWLRRLNPRMPKFFADKIRAGKAGKSNGPFFVGLLNGFMPCGPLQAMQLYALGTGSFVKGALSMFFFSAGTLPLMFGLSALSAILSKKFTRAATAAGAVMVVLMGTAMFGNGMNLTGFSAGSALSASAQDGAPVQQDKVQLVRTELGPYEYQPIKVQVGIPVRWTINAEPGTVNGCNNRFIIPDFDRLQKQLVVGENIVEFTPTKVGTFIYSCWMGMIGGRITVVEEDAGNTMVFASALSQAAEAVPSPADGESLADAGGSACPCCAAW